MLNVLTKDVQNLEEMKLLNVRLHEEEHVNASFMKDENVSDAMINLHRHQKRKRRKKCRFFLGEGIPTRDTCLSKHSNEPIVCLLFKIDPTKKKNY